GLLRVRGGVVTEGGEVEGVEVLELALQLLQEHDVGLPLFEPGEQALTARADGIHVPGGDPHAALLALRVRRIHPGPALSAARSGPARAPGWGCASPPPPSDRACRAGGRSAAPARRPSRRAAPRAAPSRA